MIDREYSFDYIKFLERARCIIILIKSAGSK